MYNPYQRLVKGESPCACRVATVTEAASEVPRLGPHLEHEHLGVGSTSPHFLVLSSILQEGIVAG